MRRIGAMLLVAALPACAGTNGVAPPDDGPAFGLVAPDPRYPIGETIPTAEQAEAIFREVCMKPVAGFGGRVARMGFERNPASGVQYSQDLDLSVALVRGETLRCSMVFAVSTDAEKAAPVIARIAEPIAAQGIDIAVALARGTASRNYANIKIEAQ